MAALFKIQHIMRQASIGHRRTGLKIVPPGVAAETNPKARGCTSQH